METALFLQLDHDYDVVDADDDDDSCNLQEASSIWPLGKHKKKKKKSFSGTFPFQLLHKSKKNSSLQVLQTMMTTMKMIPVTCKRQVASDLLANTIRSPSGERGAQTCIDKNGRNECQNHNFKKMKIEIRNFRKWKKIDSCNDNINILFWNWDIKPCAS